MKKKPESVGAGDVGGYFEAAYVLAGVAPANQASAVVGNDGSAD